MNGWTEQELIHEAAFQYEWGYSGELEKAARECIARIKADAWDEGYDVGGNDVGSGWRDNELTPNPYREDT